VRDPVYDGEVPLESAQDWLQANLYPESLYDGSPPSEDSDTSRAAAKSMTVTSNSMRGKVLTLIEEGMFFGVTGATDDEVEDYTGWLHQTVSARRRELVLLGKIKDSGMRRKTRSGRQATVWVLS
jgi:hypothetical protein